MENFPEKVLSSIAVYLDSTTRALFAVALTAPSSSWERCGWSKAPSRASKIVLSGVHYSWRNDTIDQKWEELDMRYLRARDSNGRWIDLASKLTDGDIGGMLACIDAKRNLKKLLLPRCVNITGRGLAPLRGSVVIEWIDLTLVDEMDPKKRHPEQPKISEEAVVPILKSMIDQKAKSRIFISLPKVWKERRSGLLVDFIKCYNQAMNERKYACCNCDNVMIGTLEAPWMVIDGDKFGVSTMTCYECGSDFCGKCSDQSLIFCLTCEQTMCDYCQELTTCGCCDITQCCGCAYGEQECTGCGRVECKECSATRYNECERCQRVSCGDCSHEKYVHCELCEKASSCIDCAAEYYGAVKQCAVCRKAFCDEHSMAVEYCFDLPGNVCLECHSRRHDCFECYWRPIPQVLRQFMDGTIGPIPIEITHDMAAEFWKTHAAFFPPDKRFDWSTYHNTQVASTSSRILAANFLLVGQDMKSVYMLLYAALADEVLLRGPDYIKRVFARAQGSVRDLLCVYFEQYRETIRSTSSRAQMVKFLMSTERTSDMITSKGQFTERHIHAIHSVQCEDVNAQKMKLAAHIWAGAYGRRYYEKVVTCRDVTLDWFVKRCVFEHDTCSVKFYRVDHSSSARDFGSRRLFLSTDAKKTLQDLDIKSEDWVKISKCRLNEGSSAPNAEVTTCDTKKSKKPKKKKGGAKKKKTKKSRAAPVQLTEEQLKEKYRQDHSNAMNPVFDELEPHLKGRRTELHNLSLKKSAPKQRGRSKTKNPSEPADISAHLPADDSLGGKAGKISYSVLVGDPCNLYKTRKALKRAPIALDLHGLSREEALARLDESLPLWIDIAMRGDDPWVIPVDIICGGGSQILAELVEKWIRSNRQVANRPKSR